MVNSEEKNGLRKTTQWRILNRPLCKVGLVFKKIFHLCAAYKKEGDSLPYFQRQLLHVYSHKENSEDKEFDQGDGNWF